jgi:hypothetical protein
VTRIRADAGVLWNLKLVPAGDVDGDGLDDFLVGTSCTGRNPTLRSYCNRVHLFFGSAGLRNRDILLPPDALLAVSWRSSDVIGSLSRSMLASLGDFNGDGMPEFAFSAPWQNEPNGRVYVASWRPEFRSGGDMEMEDIGKSLPGFVLEGYPLDDGVETGDFLCGFEVNAAGDLNGDGLQDLYVGSVREYAFVVFGAPEWPPVLGLDDLGGRGVELRAVPLGNGSFVGTSMFMNGTGAGDIDGDECDDLLVTSYDGTQRGPAVLRVHVIWGRPEFPQVLELNYPGGNIDSETLTLLTAQELYCVDEPLLHLCYEGDRPGYSLAGPGDIDLDGYTDILIGADNASRFGRAWCGMSYLVYGGPELRAAGNSLPLPLISEEYMRTSVMIGPHQCDHLSSWAALAGVGDFDGDGEPDVAVGTRRTTSGTQGPQCSPEQSGLYLILRGQTGALFRRGDCNDDGRVDLTDAVCILSWLFLGEIEPGCLAATNTNGDPPTDLADAVYLLNHLFLGGNAPVAPYPECGRGSLPSDEGNCVRAPQSCLQ